METAKGQLDRIPENDPAHAGATKVLARFQEDVAKAAIAEGKKARKAFADEAQHEFLMKGMDARFTTDGADATTLHFHYVLAGAPLVEQLKTDGTFINRCQSIGFKKLILDDTFGKTWTFTF